MADPATVDFGYGQDSSEEPLTIDRPEASESGIITEMEHRRSESMSSVDLRQLTHGGDDPSGSSAGSGGAGGGHHKSKAKGRRLSTRVARGIKKQFTTSGDRSRPRSMSPPRSQRSLTSGSENESSDVDHNLSPLAMRRTATDFSAGSYEPKKKHKLKYKPIAKAAAHAATKGKKAAAHAAKVAVKKVTSSSGGSSKHKEDDMSQSFRSTTPTNLHVHPQSTANTVAVGKTPMNTPVNATTIVDRAAIDSVVHELPATLAEVGDEEVDAGVGGDAEESMAFEEATGHPPKASKTTTQEGAQPTIATNTPLQNPAAAAGNPTEDEALKLAEAMAIAVASNPTKSQEEIRRMVYSQPEFKHLSQPEAPGSKQQPQSSSSSSDSTSKLLKKNFSNIKKQITSGAGTAQKKFLEMADATNLGSSITNFSFGIATGSSGGSSSSSGAKAPPTTTGTAPPPTTTTSASGASASSERSAGSGVTTTSNMDHTVTTIPENAEVSNMENSTSTAGISQNSLPSISAPADATAATLTTDEIADGSASGTSSSKKWRELPIKITDIVWKRRSGFGKFSTDAWERRRFVLQGNVLSYYRAKGNTTEPMEDDTEQFDEGHRRNMHSAVTEATVKHTSSGGAGKATKKMFDYMEQMAVSAGLAPGTVIAAEKTDEEKKSSARGYMDLIKENAVICATLGHSGAPSPFCLSIKVEGVTKWKLCFSSHRSQLQWMAAISDVIVQASVDIYNVKLLTKADPTNLDPTQAFQPSVYEPPTNDEMPPPSSQKSMDSAAQKQHLDGEDELLPQPSLHVSGKRLWIMEPYIIRPQNGEDDDDTNDDGSVDSSSSYEEDDEDIPTAATAKATPEEELNDRDIWSLPEKKLILAAAIINATILLTRNSTMSVQTFWTVVTFANIALFAFLESNPSPAMLKAAAAAAGTAATATVTKKKARKTKKRKGKRSGLALGGDIEGGADGEARADGATAKKEEPFVPSAGMSAIRVDKPDDSMENANGDKFSRWCAVDGETVLVRSHGYMSTKAKIPSPGTLYELTQVDIFESPARYPDMSPRVKLPKLAFEIDPKEEKTWKSPDHFVISLSLPTDPPKLGASTSDGGGYTVTMYYTMRKTTREILKRVTADGYQPSSEERPEDVQKWQVNAVRLFEEWCRRAPNDIKFQTRFKMVPNVVNAKEIGLPSWIGKYNGKPLLIKRPGQTGFLLPHPELSCIEFDISLHVFPYLAKQGICYLKDTMFSKLLATVGFVIEGRDDDELPEVLIGLAQVCYPDPEHVMQASGFFDGTAPRSYDPNAAAPALAPEQ